MNNKNLTIYNLAFSNKITNNQKIKQKVLNKSKQNLLFNFTLMKISDLNNTGVITLNLIHEIKNIIPIKWIYFSKQAYTDIEKTKAFEKISILTESLEQANNNSEIIKIEDINPIKVTNLHNKSFDFRKKELEVESLLFETKDHIKYINSIQNKLQKINEFVDSIYEWNPLRVPFNLINHLEEYVEYIQSNPEYKSKLKPVKIMVDKLHNYKIWKKAANLKEIVLQWSLELTLILKEHFLDTIENFNNETKKHFIVK